MITIQSVMQFALGFLAAALIGLVLAPFYRRRAERLATEALKARMPLTQAEIAADKDRLRALYAIDIHRLEKKIEKSENTTAKQLVELNRRDAAISALEGEVMRLRTGLEEHENARRVLEQTITDRLPKVEFRLSEAKKLLLQRDREIANLTVTSSKQAQALEEATQINTQQREELQRLNATLTARAARNREAPADQRFDGEVALRTEVEALRNKAREQTSLIGRLQAELAKVVSGGGRSAGTAEPLDTSAVKDTEAEIARLRKSLADAEVALKSARGVAEAGTSREAAAESEIRRLKAQSEDQASEIVKLKAALKAFEDDAPEDASRSDSKLALRARVSALQAQANEQSATIQRLRADVASANEKLARQADHFMEEMRRLGAGTRPLSAPPTIGSMTSSSRPVVEEAQKPPRQSLVDRINAPRPQRADGAAAPAANANGNGAADDGRVSGFLRALAGGPEETEAREAQSTGTDGVTFAGESASADQASPEARPVSLIDRLTRSGKPQA